MLDVVVDRFSRDDKLGMVFPDDPHLSDWDYNREIAEGLPARMGSRARCRRSSIFRSARCYGPARKHWRLFSLGLQWSDYPEEPVPIDGTILHAKERLLPFTAAHAGYGHATIHIPGVTW